MSDTTERSYLDIDDDFNHSHGIVDNLTRLVVEADSDQNIEDIMVICGVETDKMAALFKELMRLYLAERKQHKQENKL